MTIVVDTGVLFALADTDDEHHHPCVAWLAATREDLLVPPLVITEAAYLIGSRGGPEAEALFLDALAPALGSIPPNLTASATCRGWPSWSAPTPTCPWAPRTPR